MPVSGEQAAASLEAAGYGLLPVSAEPAAAVEDLPPIDAAPLDRLLVARALTEPLRLLTHDRTVARYSDTIPLVSWRLAEPGQGTPATSLATVERSHRGQLASR